MPHPATVTAPQNTEWLPRAAWLERHQSLVAAKDRNLGTPVVFLGDSITEGWAGEGLAAWEKHFARYKPVNLGIGGDETQHILYRLGHGAVAGLSPKLTVLLIGTNNIGNAGHPAEPVAEGVKLIIEKLQKDLPQAKVLLQAVLPRDPVPNTPFRREILKLNRLLSGFHDGKRVFFQNLYEVFLGPEEALLPSVMPDYLHLSPSAYETWACHLAPEVERHVG